MGRVKKIITIKNASSRKTSEDAFFILENIRSVHDVGKQEPI
jgi:hypothetical protein